MAINYFSVKALAEASASLSGEHYKAALLYIQAYQKGIVTESQLKVALSALKDHANGYYDEPETIVDIIDYVEYRLDDAQCVNL